MTIIKKKQILHYLFIFAFFTCSPPPLKSGAPGLYNRKNHTGENSISESSLPDSGLPPGGSPHNTGPTLDSVPPVTKTSEWSDSLLPQMAVSDSQKTVLLKKGASLYQIFCTRCHGPNGNGVEGVYPPLRDSDYFVADQTRAIKSIIQGISGPMVVNGKKYDGLMDKLAMTDEEIAAVISYINISMNGLERILTEKEVAGVRNGLKGGSKK